MRSTVSPGNPSTIRPVAEAGRMRVTCDAPMVGGDLGSSVVAVRDQSMRWMLGSLNMAANLGTELFVVNSGYVDGNQERLRDSSFRVCVSNLREPCDDAEKHGIRVGLENDGAADGSLDRCVEKLLS